MNAIQTLSRDKTSLWRRFAVIQGVATAVLLAALTAGWLPTARLAGPPGVHAMLAAAAVIWVIFSLSMLPMLLMNRPDAPPKQAGLAVLSASALRFILILFVTLPIVLLDALPPAPFLVWIGISYLAVLAADTITIVYLLSPPKD